MKVAAWKDAWWRHTIRGMHHTDADPSKTWLTTRRRTLGKRRWDDAVQKYVKLEASEEAPWQDATEDPLKLAEQSVAPAQGGRRGASTGRTLDGSRTR